MEHMRYTCTQTFARSTASTMQYCYFFFFLPVSAPLLYSDIFVVVVVFFFRKTDQHALWQHDPGWNRGGARKYRDAPRVHFMLGRRKNIWKTLDQRGEQRVSSGSIVSDKRRTRVCTAIQRGSIVHDALMLLLPMALSMHTKRRGRRGARRRIRGKAVHASAWGIENGRDLSLLCDRWPQIGYAESNNAPEQRLVDGTESGPRNARNDDPDEFTRDFPPLPLASYNSCRPLK